MLTAQIAMALSYPTGADAVQEEWLVVIKEVLAKGFDCRKLPVTNRLTDERDTLLEVIRQRLPDDLGSSIPGC